jgi:hypothetical protein
MIVSPGAARLSALSKCWTGRNRDPQQLSASSESIREIIGYHRIGTGTISGTPLGPQTK